MKILCGLLCTFLAGTLVTACAAQNFQSLSLQRVGSGLARPINGTFAPGDVNRMFVAEQNSGDIKILNLTDSSVSTFMTVPGVRNSGNEQGLLGMAFHPDYVNNGLFYVNFTNLSGDTQIQEFARLNANQGDVSSVKNVLSFSQPFSNHNGGWMGFGNDGLLYISSGDGGSGNDPLGNGQDVTSLLGKILRVDVNGDDFAGDNSRNYAIPSSNPFVGIAGDDEILAYGLRNPWKSSFDSQTGDLWIGDVGQGSREEIDVMLAADIGSGQNYGWGVREGTLGPVVAFAIDPVYEYPHGNGPGEGRSVTGGAVYRGPISALNGHYFFGDYVSNQLWSLRLNGNDEALFDGTNFSEFVNWSSLGVNVDAGDLDQISGFAEDSLGNLYILGLDGDVHRISGVSVPEPLLGDANLDGVVDFLDISRFIALLSAGGFQAEADIDQNGTVDFLDISPFIAILSGQQ